MKRNKQLFFTIYFIVIGLVILRWFECSTFGGIFHFSKLDLNLRLIEAIHNDSNMPLFIVRVMHNKIIGVVLDIYTSYIRFWDISFLINLLSLLGVFGFCLGIYYFLSEKKKNKYVVSLFCFLLVLPLLEIIFNPQINFIAKIGFLFIPLQVINIYGLWNYLKQENRTKISIAIVLLFISIWWIYLFGSETYSYCVNSSSAI